MRMAERYSATKETLIRFVKDSAQYVLDNAEDLVGENKSMTGLDIKISVDVDCLPQVTLERRYVTAGWNEKRLVYREVE